MNDKAKVAVVGATGYAGFELARLLLRHPHIEKPVFFVRGEHANVHCLTEIFPQLRGWGEARCTPLSAEAIAKSGAQLVFLSTPHEASLEIIPELLANNPKLRIVDLSGALRFRNPQTFAHWYKLSPADSETLSEAVYGLPETLFRHFAQSSPGRESRLLCNLGNPGLASSYRSWMAQRLPWRGMRLQIRSERRGQGTQTRNSFR